MISSIVPSLLGVAVLLPLLSFVIICLLGPRMGRNGEGAGYVALGAIVTSFVLSMVSLVAWLSSYPLVSHGHHASAEHASAETEHASADGGASHQASEHDGSDHHATGHESASSDEHGSEQHADNHHSAQAIPTSLSGVWYVLGRFGQLEMNIGYFVDALTVAMFCMVTLIASCIHMFAWGTCMMNCTTCRSRSDPQRRHTPQASRALLPLFPVSVALLLQHARFW